MFIPLQTIQLIEKLGVNDIKKIQSKLLAFKEHLLKANHQINLISRQRSARVFDTLTYDSVAILQFYNYQRPATLIDVGSGGGFPWVIHKAIHSDLRVNSVDSNNRKIEFQQSVARLLDFSDCHFHAERAEGLKSLEGDYLIAKAFGSITEILELGFLHLKHEGLLIMPRSGDEAEPEMSKPGYGAGFAPRKSEAYTNPFAAPGHRTRQLLIYEKVGV